MTDEDLDHVFEDDEPQKHVMLCSIPLFWYGPGNPKAHLTTRERDLHVLVDITPWIFGNLSDGRFGFFIVNYFPRNSSIEIESSIPFQDWFSFAPPTIGGSS